MSCESVALLSFLLNLVTLTRVNLPVWERVMVPGLRNPERARPKLRTQPEARTVERWEQLFL